MAKLPCSTWKNRERCEAKAVLFVKAFGQAGWSGYYCEKHGPWIIKKRMRLIKKYKQNVVVRPITAYDRKARKERMKV